MLEKNLEALGKVNPQLKEWLIKENKQNWYTLIKSKNGQPNFLLNNKKVNGHNITNPSKEAKNSLGEMKYHKDEATIIFGMGLGYLPAELFKKSEKGHTVIVVEADASLVIEAFKIHDFTKPLLSNKFFIAIPSKEEVVSVIGLVETMYVVSNWLMIVSGYVMHKTDIYYELYEYTMGVINQVQCNTGTVSGAGWQLAQNDIANLPYIIKHRGVKDIFDIYKDKPAVIVSTGPSLAKNIHLLKEIEDKAIIICVGQALRILLAYDIKPDFACTVDFGDVNATHFEGIWDSDVPLVALTRTYSKILKKYRGHKFIVGTQLAGYKNSSSSIIEEKGFLPQGGSVAHLSLGLAIKLGCKNIAMIGQDLSYDADKSHNPNADSSGDLFVENGLLMWKITDPKSNLYGKTYSMGQAKYVPGFWGNNVLTNLGLASFIHSFENIVQTFNNNFVNCTEGGAKIKGTKQNTLQGFIDEYCKKKINKSAIEKYLSYDENYIDMMKRAKSVMEEEIKDYTNLVDNAKKALKAANSISSAGANKKKLLAENEKYSLKAEEIAKNNPLVNVAIYKESRIIQSRKYTVNGKVNNLMKNSDDLNTRIERNKLILKSAVKHSKTLLQITKESLNLIDEYLNGNDLLVDNSEIIVDLKDADEFISNGNFARPLLDSRRLLVKNPDDKKAKKVFMKSLELRADAINNGIKYQESNDWKTEIEYKNLIDLAHAKGKNISMMAEKDIKKNLKESEKYLSNAVKLKPDEFMGLWGLATVKHHLGKIKESVNLYEKILKLNQDVSLKFEYATVMLKHDINKALQLFKEIFEQTKQYDYYMSTIADVYLRLGDTDKAKSFYEAYLDKYKTDINVWNKLLNISDDKDRIVKIINKLEFTQ